MENQTTKNILAPWCTAQASVRSLCLGLGGISVLFASTPSSATIMITTGLPAGYHASASGVGPYWLEKDDLSVTGELVKHFIAQIVVRRKGDYQIRAIVSRPAVPAVPQPVECKVAFGVMPPNGLSVEKAAGRGDTAARYSFTSKKISWQTGTRVLGISSNCTAETGRGIRKGIPYTIRFFISTPLSSGFREFTQNDFKPW